MKSRAKRTDTNEWIYGYYIENDDRYYIISNGLYFNIKKETLCRFVGNLNGIDIYEHDIIEDVLSIRWCDEKFSFEFYWTYNNESAHIDVGGWCLTDIFKQVIGNVFDNPELIK
jgi:hypothetical protein